MDRAICSDSFLLMLGSAGINRQYNRQCGAKDLGPSFGIYQVFLPGTNQGGTGVPPKDPRRLPFNAPRAFTAVFRSAPGDSASSQH